MSVGPRLPQYSFDLEDSGSDQALLAVFDGATDFGDTFSFTTRLKRESIIGQQYILNHRTTAIAQGWYVRLQAGNRIRVAIGANWTVMGFPTTTADIFATSTTRLNDTDEHEILVIFDLANSTTADRIIIYIDGVRETLVADNIPSETITPRHINNRLRIGADNLTAQGYDGLLYNVAASSSGNLLALSDIAESDGTAKDLKDFVGLSFHLDADAGLITSDFEGNAWGTENGPVLSTTLLDAAV